MIVPNKKERRYVLMVKKRERGQALVEFAIIVPILITIVCGIIDFGWIYYNNYRVEDAAYEGARYASIVAADKGIGETMEESAKARVKKNLPNNGEGATINISTDENEVTVEVIYPVKNLTFVGQTISGKYYYATSISVATI